jgi:hypothetical protein
MEIWGHLALRPGPDWRERFLDSEGVEWGEMLDAVPALHDIDELLQLPFFLRTAVDLWKHGALEGVDGVNALIDRLLDNAIASEDGGLPPEGLRFWLRKIAAALQLAGRLGISDEELATIPLPDELAARGTSKELVEELLAKPILRRTAEGYRFAHRLIGERLVADELVEIGPSPGALEVVAPVVTESIHGLNQVWAVPAILAAVQSPAWREALAARDPLAAALSTPPLAPREERLAAGRRIWQTYIDWQIWLFSGREFDLLEPGAVLTQLLNSGDLPELVDEVVGALHDDSAYTRGNALQLVGRLGLQDRISDDELGRMLTDDENGVVRRFAATAAARLSRHDLLPKIAERLGAATDSVERQDLCYAAADLATDDELRELGVRYAEGGIDTMYLATASERRLDPKSRLEVIRAHAERDAQPIPSDRQKLIELLARFPAEDIAAEDVERAGFIAAAWHLAEPEVIGFLAHHPEDALRGFQAAISSETTYAYEHELAAFSECFDPDLLRAAGVTDQVVGWVDERRRQTEAGTP